MTARERVYLYEGPPRIEVTRINGGSGHVVEVQRGQPGVVVIAQRDGAVLFVNVDRGTGPALELPRGFGEMAADGEGDPQDDAVRECKEETGYDLRNPTACGRFLIDSALYPQVVVVVAGDVDSGLPSPETDGEVGAAQWATAAQVDEWIRAGLVRDAITMAALVHWRALGGSAESV